MILKQNIQTDNLFFIEIPKVQLSFFFNKETEINKINLFNNIILFWFLVGKIISLKSLNYRLERGIRYYNFNLSLNLNNMFIFFKFIDFFFNNVDFYIRKNERTIYKYNNNYLYYLKNLELFSNLRLSYSYYTSKMYDRLFLKYYLKNNNIKIDVFMNKFKII